ncbi:tetratricopeptide repeat protein [Lutibacter sp. A80]|uniref:tetratricopeptide repeat protein n=1 Tax=Lutibacter sp. A80 TaxID=2918453 RepID=UPI001F063534|nr:tetratricopeptide repeat protein [Lutibacter sp. A80]UMB60642.1 tetratricopeptide repeat protein [Lutibacter sp. A80]
MKKQLIFLSALFITITVFGQKNELKTADKAIKNGDFSSALAAINQAESLIGSADQKLKAKYYYLKGKALYQEGANSNVEEVAVAFNELLAYEKETNKLKYSNEIKELINSLVQSTAGNASKDYEVATQSKLPADYVKAAKGFAQVYALSPTDTTFLDNAALVYFMGEDYNSSKEAYQKLLDLNYTGISTVYIANNKSDGKEVVYPTKKAMDVQVKLGIAENPREEVKESRREMIFKNLAQNYAMLEDSEKALEVITQGREEFPSSYSLLIDEANLYYKAGDNDKFKEKLEEAISLNPTEPTLYYNVGVMNMGQGNLDEAISSFEKAVELKPDYADAYNNIGAAIIEKATPIIDEMNKNLSDFDKYDSLQKEQFEIYKKALPYYEKAYEINNENISVIQTLMGLYENLEMTDKLNEIKAVYDGLK